MVGQCVSHYEVIEHVGSGGMGVVYRARDTRLEREVALKFLRASPGRKGQARARFEAEARAASKLDHPNICAIYDIDETPDGTQFIAMAYCPGPTLEERLQEGGVTVEEAVMIGLQVADGLAAAHARGVVHRDVKPGNILVADDGRVKIVDFGIAKLAGTRLTMAGAMIGTVAYMAPEQIRGADSDARADVWAFGVLLYQMLTRRLPFEAAYDQAAAYRILHEAPDPLEVDLPSQYRELEELIGACLEKDPAKRPASMEEVADRLHLGRTGTPQEKRIAGRTGASRKALAGFHATGVAVLGLALAIFAGSLFLGGAPAVPAEKHVVVLPLTAPGGSAEDQLFSAGLTATLTHKLAQLAAYTDQSFWVVPHTEVRERDVVSPSAAQRAFGASLVLEGTLVRTATALRLSFSLTDARSLRTVAAQDLVVAAGQIDRLQEEAARRVAEMMQVHLGEELDGPLAAGRTSDPEAYEQYLRGVAYLERSDLKENLERAVNLFRQATERDPAFAAAFAGLGTAKWQIYETTRDELYIPLALRHLEHALAIDPHVTEARITLAWIYSETGRPEEGLREIGDVIARQPRNADAYVTYGRMLEKGGRTDAAETALQHAVSLRPAYWAGYNALGAFYMRRGRYDDAATLFRQAALLTPDNPQVYSNLGVAYQRLNRTADAVASYERSIELHPTAAALSNLASIHYFVERDMEKAVQTYLRALSLEDGNYRYWLNLAAAYRQLGRRDDKRAAQLAAIRLAERQIELNPGDYYAQADLVGLYIDTGDAARGRALLQLLSKHEASDVEVLYMLAEGYEKLGERDEALDWLCAAAQAGYPLAQIEQAPTLALLRSDPAFARVRACTPSP